MILQSNNYPRLKEVEFSILKLRFFLFFIFLNTFLVLDVSSQITVRETARQDYINNYTPSSFNIADMAWTGNIAGCNEGTVSQVVHNRIIQRMNYYRRMVGVEDQVVLDATLNAKCQKAALIMEANGGLSHDPPMTWNCWSQDGRDAAASSNLSAGSHDFFNLIDNYISDDGGGNQIVGHRRWILYSRGKTYGNGITPNAQSLWTFGNGGSPEIYTNFIAYPPAGFIPRNLAFDRWSFSHPDADFANANVSMTGPNGNVTLIIVSRTDNGFGDNTIVWEPVGIDKTNTQDIVYTVTVSGITGTTQTSYTYMSTLFDPAQGGGTPSGFTCADPLVITAAGTFNAPGPSMGNGANPANDVGANHANWYRFEPPTTGSITISSCGAPNTHNHIYDNFTSCANIGTDLANITFTADRGCQPDTNDVANGTLITGIPVTAGTPIYIEWDDAYQTPAAFTWSIAYEGGGACPANVTVSAATMGNTLATTSITTQGTVTANTAVFSAPVVNINGDFSVPAGQCFEINNVGCTYTGILSCDGGGGQGMGTCASPYVLTCGTPFNGNTSNGTSTWTSYDGGDAAYGGPETIHTITIPANTPRTLTLTSLVDMDLFVSSTCNSAPIAFTGDNLGNESVNIPANANQMIYYLIVDGWDSVTGDYTLACN